MIRQKNIQQMDFNLLKVFECLYIEQNMTKAANVLFISPSAVSHAIQRLRNHLNDPLFIREGKRMVPTAVCQRIAPQLLDTLIRLRQILCQCGEFETTMTEQTFKIAIHDAIEVFIVPKLIQLLQQQAPLANLVCTRLDRQETTRQLSSGQIDIVIDVALSKREPIKHYKLVADHFCVLMDKSNPIRSNLNEKDYLSSQHIAVSNRSKGSVIEDIAFQQKGINRKIKVRCQSYQTAKDVLVNSAMLLTLPQLLAEHLSDENCVIEPIPITISKVETHLYWHMNTDQDKAVIWLRGLVKSLFKPSE